MPNEPERDAAGVEDEALEVEEIEDPFLTALDALAGVENAHVAVYRRERGNPQWEGNLSLEEFSLETVRATWGGGKYDFRLIRGNKYVKGRTVVIAGPPKASTVVETREGLEGRREAETSHKRDQLQDMSMAEAVMELRNDLRGFLQEVRNPPPAAATANPATMAVELVSTIQSLMAPYLETLGGGRSGGDLDPMEYIQMGMELARGGAENDGYGRVMKELGFPLFKMLQAQGMAEGLPDPEVPQLHAPAPTNAIAALRPWIPQLIDWAVSRRDPRLRADLIADELPAHYSEMLAEFVGTPDALTAFFTAYPEAMAQRVWFEQLFEGLSYAYGLDDDDGQGTEVGGGGGPTGPEAVP